MHNRDKDRDTKRVKFITLQWRRKKETHQKKNYERERERELSYFSVGNMDWMRDNILFVIYSKEDGIKRVKIRRRWIDRERVIVG